MISGKLLNVVGILKEVLMTRINDIYFDKETFETNDVENIRDYSVKMLDLINAIYQDYITCYLSKNDVIRVNLKEFTYEKVI